MEQKDLEKLVDAFEIEELEDRLEFLKWTGGCKVGASEEQGAYGECGMGFEFSNS